MKLKILATIAALLAGPGSSAALAQALPVPANIGSATASAGSWLLGAQAGYDWQTGPWVYGLAADISATHLNSQANTTLVGGFGVPASVSADIDWYGTVRGRLGWSSGPLLLYGTGGLAYGRIALSGSLMAVPPPPLGLNAQTSSVNVGWVAGAGVEYLWSPNVVLSLDYQYVDLGSTSVATGATAAGQGFSTLNANARGQFQAVTVGVSWLFSPRVAGAPWQGGCLGGHVGGAWGNDTNASFAYFPGFVSDIRLKRDIVLVGHLDNGLGLYRYRYLWSDAVFVGVMAQEVALIRPDAVVRDGLDDYLRVDYDRLGLKLMTLPEWNAISGGKKL
jgi:outer membrane immunogenic protein